MENKACTWALDNALSEVQKVCPQIHNSFIFNGQQILAVGKDKDKEVFAPVVNAIAALEKETQNRGSLTSLTVCGSNGQVIINKTGDFCIGTFADRQADQTALLLVTRVLVPAVLNAVSAVTLEYIAKTAEENNSDEAVELASKSNNNLLSSETVNNPVFSDAPVTQLLVEALGGFGKLLGDPDFVRIDNSVIAQWGRLFGDKSVEEVDVQEALTGKTVRRRFKPLADGKLKGNGVIQMPEKIQHALGTHKGALVTVRPVVK
jgi:hypothetical protein